MPELIKPIPLVLKCEDGKERTYILSNFPAVDGREIVSKYIAANMPKIGDYKESEEIMIKLMSYVAVKNGPVETRLSTKDLINNHCPGFEELMKIEMAMMEKNCSFFRDGRSLDFLENLTQMVARKVSEMLMLSSVQSSPTEKQALQS
jgi:hypothetical protein